MYRNIVQVPLVAGVAALLYTYLPHLSSKTYCYTSITSLSSDVPADANCMTIGRDGTITDIFASTNEQNMIPGHVIPGLWDGHGHLLQYGELLNSVNLFGAASLDEVRTRIKDYIALHPTAGGEDEWIRGVGWDQAAYGRMPTAADLDADPALEGKYIMLDRIDVHCAWVSSSVLSLLPSPLPSSPVGGEIVTQPGPGVFCDNAMPLVLAKWPKPDKAKKTMFIRSAMKALNKVGLVGMHDAGSVPKDLRLFESLAGTQDWTVRVYGMMECDVRNTFCPGDAVRLAREDGMLSVRSVKLFADGALGSWGSAMLEPYSDRPDTTGSSLVNASTLTSLAINWARLGYQVNIHAIGDLANRWAIDALEAALKTTYPPSSPSSGDTPSTSNLKTHQQIDKRHRIEHSQITSPPDQLRLHALGIIPSIQPTHATSDMLYALSRLGHKRLEDSAYRMKSLLPLHPILGSDFPVEPPNPFHGMYAAVARKSPATGLAVDIDGLPGVNASWYASEALSIQQALQGFTASPARGAFLEGKAGVLQKGAWADWVVLEEGMQPRRWEESIEMLRTGVSQGVLETWVGGRKVYDRALDDEGPLEHVPAAHTH